MARSVSIVTREQASQAAAGNVGDMLSQAHAVVVQRTASGSATPILRGLTGYQVLLMADDLRLNDSLTRAGGSATLNLIDPESVAQIDVIRGPASVLYGSDALGGVVHVRTQGTKASETAAPWGAASAFVRGASAERSLRAQGSVDGALGPFGLRISGGAGHAGELLRGGDLGLQPFTGHTDWSIASRFEAVPARDHRIAVAYQAGHQLQVPRPDVSREDDRQRTVALTRDAAVLSYTGRPLRRRVRLHIFGAIVLRHEQRERVRPMRAETEWDEVLGLQMGVRAGVKPWRSANLELGAESTLDRVESRGERRSTDGTLTPGRGRYVDGSRYDMHAAYALLSQGLGTRTLLLVGGRSTWVEAHAPVDPLFEPTLGPRAALDRSFAGVVGSMGVRQAFRPELAWTTSLLSGFRAPNLEDFQAFGGGARGITVPNLSLRDERTYTLESGVEANVKNFSAQAFVFGSVLRHLIVRVPHTFDGMDTLDGEPIFTRENGSQTYLTGGELSVLYQSERGPFASAASWLSWGTTRRPNDDGSTRKEPATKVPPAIGVLRVGYNKQPSPYFGEAVLRMQHSQRRLSEADKSDVRLCMLGAERCSEVPGFWDLTLRAGLRLEHIFVSVAVENLFDAAYKTYASGVYAPGRNFVLALRGTL
jgi:outer membrane receptor protein involved in Fe transport